MRKITALILSAILASSLAACGDTTPASQGTSDPSGVDNDVAMVDLSGEITGEITVSTYDTMKSKEFLEGAARLFEEKYPGTTVNVETFSAMPEVKTSEQNGGKVTMVRVEDDPQGRQDYVNKISTQMMSGGGADVLALDVLPIHKYAESGQLENLDAYMQSDPDFQQTDYRTNVLEAAKYNGTTWFLPLDYSFDYFAYDSTLINADTAAFGTGSAFSTNQLFELATGLYDGGSKLFNTPAYQGMGDGGMWRNLLNDSYDSYVDIENRTVNFDDGSFSELLNTVQEYSEQAYIPQPPTAQTRSSEPMELGKTPTDRFYFKSNIAFSLLNQFTRGTDRKMNMVFAGSVQSIDEDDEVAGIHANADGSVPFTYSQGYGINSNSENKVTAWAFVKFLLSEEMQSNTNLSVSSFPLHNGARAKQAESLFSGSFMGQQGEPLDESQKTALAQYEAAVEQLSDQINCYNWNDTIVNDMIVAEVKYFFDGSKTADEVADTLQSKIELYLSE